MHHGRLLGVVIPARNEEEHIEAVLSSLPEMVDVAVYPHWGSPMGCPAARVVNQESTAVARCRCFGIRLYPSGCCPRFPFTWSASLEMMG